MNSNQLIHKKRIIEKLAVDAGELLLSNFGKIKPNDIEYKSAKDIVTMIDKASEDLIVNGIKTEFPNDMIIAEERTTANLSKSSNCWIIDPLDGTTNYLHNLPYFAVSIAYQENGETLLGAVYLPILNELFTAEKNRGAYLNGKRIKVTQTDELVKALAVTGFACLRANKPDHNLDNFCRIAPQVREIRRLGAAAADGCYVAAGRFDFFWEKYLQKWDIAAATLIVREAGGIVSDFNGVQTNLDGSNVIMSNANLHQTLLKLIK